MPRRNTTSGTTVNAPPPTIRNAGPPTIRNAGPPTTRNAAPNTTLLTGYARLPSGITASRVSDVVGVAVEVDPVTGEILAAECTLSTELARGFFSRLVVGHRLEADFPAMLKEIERRYHGSAQKALITALKTVLEKYQSRREG